MKKLLLCSLVLSALGSHAQFWTAKPTGFTTASRGINGIHIVDANVVWAKAYDGSGGGAHIREYTRSTNGGETWTPGSVNVAGIQAGSDIGSITAVSATNAWVTTNPSAQGGTNGVYVTTNGTSWSKQTTAAFTSASFSNLVHFWDANNGVCQGDPTNDYFEIYTTSNGGTTWTRVAQANIPDQDGGEEYGYTGNYAVAGNTIWFGTSTGRLFRSSDFGATWQAFPTPVPDFGSATLGGAYTFSDNNKGLLSREDGTLYSTNDGGETWTPVTYNGTLFVGDISYVPGTSMVVATSVSGAAVNGTGSAYSLDDGLNWITVDTGVQYNTVRFYNNTTGFAGGFNTSSTVGGIYKYTGTALSTSDFEGKQLVVGPNPSNGIFTITGAPVKSVVVTDMLGKQVYSADFGLSTYNNIDLTSAASGIFLMTVTGENGMQKTIKLVKK
jgi:photosystem II stability/assembly factor-like uncharacterized protein